MLIEQSMIFALGFLSALLFILLFLPAFWNRAIRLSIGKISERLPLSMAEVAAERDGVRAESAIAQRRLEQQRERAEAARDEERGRVGRLNTKVAKLELEIEAHRLDASKRDLDLFATRRDLLTAEAELGIIRKDQYDADLLLERAARDTEDMAREQQRLRDVADQRRMTIASLEVRMRSMQANIDDLEGRDRNHDAFSTSVANATGQQSGMPADVERLSAALAERDRRLAAVLRDNETLRRDVHAANLSSAPRDASGTIQQDGLALLRKSITEVAAEVVRLGGLRDVTADAPNVLQIRRAAMRDPAKLPAAEGQSVGQGKSVGAN